MSDVGFVRQGVPGISAVEDALDTDTMLKYTDTEILNGARVRRARTSRSPRSGTAASIRRKNLLLDQAKIDRARRIFKASTETEAIHRALDAAADLEAFQRELDIGFDALIGAGGFVDRFD